MQCYSLEKVKLDQSATIGQSAFKTCTALSEMVIRGGTLGTNMATGCTNLKRLIITGPSIPSIYTTTFNSSPLSTSPVASLSGGKVYVPESLYATYISTPVWSFFYNSDPTLNRFYSYSGSYPELED